MAAWDNDPLDIGSQDTKISMPWDNDPVIQTAGQSDTSNPWNNDTIIQPNQDEVPQPENSNILSSVGQYESQDIKGALQDIQQAGQPFNPDNADDSWFRQNIERVGQYVGGPVLGTAGLALSPVVSTAQGITEQAANTTYNLGAPEGAGPVPQEELQRAHNISGAIGGTGANILLALSGAKNPVTETPIEAAPNEPILPNTSFTPSAVRDNSDLLQGQQEALAQVAVGARNPTTLTPEQYASNIQDIAGKPNVSYINDQINTLAADTSIPGNKEKIVELQKQKDEALNPQTSINNRISDLNGRITDEQYQTNIQYPVQNALDSGVPVNRIKDELDANLAVSIKDPDYRSELVEKAIPEAYKQASDTANTAGLVTHTNPEVVDSLVMPAIKYPDDGSVIPSLAPAEPKQLGATAVNTILNSTSKQRSLWVDDMNLLDLMDRASFKLNEKDIGRLDMAERGDLTLSKNMSQRGAAMVNSLVGDASGTNDYILKSFGRSSILKKDDTILPLNTAVKRAKIGGMDEDQISEFLRARDAYDDYANIDRQTTEVKQQLADNQNLLSKLQAVDTTGMNFIQRRSAFSKIEQLKQDVLENKRFLQDSANKQSHVTPEETSNILAKYQDNPVAQQLGTDINGLHNHLLDILLDSGKISKESADNIRTAHPNYIPAWRDVDDFSFGGNRYQTSGGAPKPFKARNISNKEIGNVYENMVLNIIQTARKAEQAKFRSGLLQDFLMPKLDDEGFNTVFRERKADVQQAINDLQSGKYQRISADEVTPTDPKKVQNVGNIVFDINGRQLQLTVLDKELFKELSQSRIYDDINPMARGIIAASRIRRNLITSWNLGFAFRAFQRDVMDFGVGAKARPFKDYIPVVSNIKYLFTKEFNPELYETITNNLGFGSTVARDFYGKNANKIAEISQKRIFEGAKPGLIRTGAHELENLSNRVDIAPRILQYKITLKNLINEGMPQLQAQEIAMRTARELNVNYAQKGTNSGLDHYIKSVPFARTFINSTDRLIRYGRYEPAKLARNTFVGLYLPYAALMQYNKQYKDTDGIPYSDKLDPTLKKDMVPIYGPWSKGVNDYIPWRLGWVFGRSLPAIDNSVSYAQQKVGELMDSGMSAEAQRIIDNKNSTAKSIKRMGISGKDVYDSWLDYTFGLLQPTSMLPVGISDLAQVAVNKDSFGRTIVPADLQKEPAFAQYRPGETSQSLTDFSYYLQNKTGASFSPMQAEYLLNSLFSSAGSISMTAGNFIYGAATGKEVPSLENKDIPLFNEMYGHGTDIPKEGTANQFYNIDQYLNPIGDTYDALKKEAERNPAHAPDLLQYQQDNAVELHYLEEYKDSLKTIKTYRDAIAQIASADKNTLLGDQTPQIETLGDPIKREKINELKMNILEVQKSILNSIQNSNLDTDQIFNERLTHSPATKLFDFPVKALDKSGKTSYNNTDTGGFLSSLNPISEAHAMDNPPAIIQQLPDSEDYRPGFFEKYLPNVRKNVVDMYRDTVIDKTIAAEGGDQYTDRPNDRGGPTKFGVTLNTLKQVTPDATANDVKNLTEDSAKDIYTDLYWKAGKIDSMPIQVQDLVFDMNVNHGLHGSGIILQRALNSLGSDVDVDGKIGNGTLNAMNDYDPKKLRDAIISQRTKWVENIVKNDPSQQENLKGWKNRISSLEEIPQEANV